MTPIELLAPAKDLACGIAAINAGADAVYIGATRFGAREAAGNTLDDIAQLLHHAHLYWAKVYVTINTLLHDEEIPQAVRLIGQLHALGIDGLIIQDLGLLECDLPPIPLIASTQMHNSSPAKVAFLEEVGFQRAILARELDLAQIGEIRRNTKLELECFIHGALCVCYSGQCYLSYALGGRSGNRGQCAQPCRKTYSLVDADGSTLISDKHLLSLRDLNLTTELGSLLDVGVTSFKIEGRLKDQAYVTNVVSHYRAQLDEAMATRGLRKSSSGDSHAGFTPHPDKTFNRGYTTYFLRGRSEPVGSIDTPKMVGETIGRVAAIRGRGCILDTSPPLHRGDGICWFLPSGELAGSTVNDVHDANVLPDKIDGLAVGSVIYRNHDHAFLADVAAHPPVREIAMTMKLRETPTGLLLVARDGDGNRAEARVRCAKEPAKQPEAVLATIRKQLQKCGGTAFSCTGVEVAFARPCFVPVAILNALRREVLEGLAAARRANHPLKQSKVTRNTIPYPEKILDFRGNVLNNQARTFYRRHGVETIEPAAESGVDLRGRAIMTTRYCLKHQLGLCSKDGQPIRHHEPLSLVDSEGHRLTLRMDCARCGMDVILD